MISLAIAPFLSFVAAPAPSPLTIPFPHGSGASGGAVVAISVLAYLLGSIPFGLIITRLAGLGDLRRIGSGNIGATNVLRTGRKGLAVATLALDGGKGAMAVAIGQQMGMDVAWWCALAVVVGHMFPVWLRFRGGKGVATTFGALLVLSFGAGALAALTWIFVAAIFRYSSLAAVVAMVSAPFYAWWLADPAAVSLVWLLTLLVIYKHRANLQRLVRGTEPKIGEKAAFGGPPPEPLSGGR